MSVKAFYKNYMAAFHKALDEIEVHVGAQPAAYETALETISAWLVALQQANKKIIIIGNGGSAAVASHLAIDFWKNAGIRAMAFNDSSLLTCIANDFSYEDVFAVPVKQFADPGDLVICISTSGRSENIIRGAKAAREAGCKVLTCSGFQPDNALRPLGDVNFFVPSDSYGVVETLHQYIIHSMLDVKMYCADEMDIFYRNQALAKNA